jgi:hypothetical protein
MAFIVAEPIAMANNYWEPQNCRLAVRKVLCVWLNAQAIFELVISPPLSGGHADTCDGLDIARGNVGRERRDGRDLKPEMCFRTSTTVFSEGFGSCFLQFLGVGFGALFKRFAATQLAAVVSRALNPRLKCALRGVLEVLLFASAFFKGLDTPAVV